jgi:hypothetical protein
MSVAPSNGEFLYWASIILEGPTYNILGHEEGIYRTGTGRDFSFAGQELHGHVLSPSVAGALVLSGKFCMSKEMSRASEGISYPNNKTPGRWG